MKKLIVLIVLFLLSLPVHAQFAASTFAKKVYRAGRIIPITLVHASNVTVTGVPKLTLTIGSTQVFATYASGSGTNTLTFNYVVNPGDSDADGIALDNNIDLNGGSLKYNGTTNCLPIITAQTSLDTVIVDTQAPSLLSVTAPAGKTYYFGQVITFTATFNELMYPTGPASIQMTAGSSTLNATASGAGLSTISFNYTVSENDLDEDGIEISSPIQLNGSLLRDGAGNPTNLNFSVPSTDGILISGTSPVVLSISGPADASYNVGENLDFILTFNKPVFVTGNPSIAVNLSVVKQANYLSGSGTNQLTFRYTIVKGVPAVNGIKIAGTYSLNGGTIRDAGGVDQAPTFLSKLFPRVIVVAPAPSITEVTVPSSPPVNGYKPGQNIDISVVYSDPVTASSLASSINLVVGIENKKAILVSGSGTNTLIYRWKVSTGATDTDGITIKSPISTNGSIISGETGLAAGLTFTPPDASSIKVVGIAPVIESNSFPPNGTYNFGQSLNFTVNYTKNVFVTGTPRLSVNIGGTTRYADYISGSGSSTLNFQYIIESNANTPGGITLSSTIDTTNGTIQDEAENLATGSLISLSAPGITIFGEFPIILSVTPPANGTYNMGDNVDFIVRFSRAVNVSGQPVFPISLNTFIKNATYLSGSGTDTLTFRYSPFSGFPAPTGIFMTGSILLEGGSIQDLSGNNAVLTYTKKTISGVIIVAPLPSIISVTGPASNPTYYKTGEFIYFTLVFSEPMFATNLTSRIPFALGPVTKYAVNISGSGTNTFIYRYTVQPYMEDQDGVELLGTLQSQGAVITSAGGAKPTLNFTPTDVSGIRVDSQLPTITSTVLPASGNYGAGDVLSFVVNYSRPVFITGTPRMQIKIGPAINPIPRWTDYVSGNGTTQLTFKLPPLEPTDVDYDGVDIYTSINVDNGTIIDEVGNNGTIWGAGTVLHAQDGSGIRINAGFSIVSVTAPAATTYKTGSNVDFQVTYPRSVNVTGTPSIPLSIGSTNVNANYVSGSGSSVLTFRYVVQNGHEDSDGLSMGSLIELNGGSIQDQFATDATLGFSPPVTTGVLIDGIDLAIASITPPNAGTYGSTQDLNFTVNFNGKATVTGTPRFQIQVGASTVNADYISGSGTTALLFRYVVVLGNNDSDGVDTLGGSINLNGGTIKDNFGDNSTLTFTPANYSAVKVDGTIPTISSVLAPASDTYYQNDPVDFTINFSEAVNVTGSPRIRLTVGATTRYATYAAGAGTTAIIFRYSVQSGDLDSDGIASISPLQLNSGTIKDLSGNSLAVLTFTPPVTTGVLVSTAAATISSVQAPANAIHKTGATLDFIVNYSRPVDVTGTPRIAITAGVSTVYANYLSGSGSDTLTFRYIVNDGDSDNNGIALVSPIELNGGTIKDSGNINGVLTYTSPNTTGVKVDGIDLVILSVTPPANATYKSTQQLNFTVTYNYPATVTGSPRIQLTVGATTLYATYVSGSTTANHIYRYTVAAGQTDADGITSVGPTILLNGGTVRDVFADNANLSFTALTYTGIKVDTTVPFISSMAASANKTYSIGENIDFTATYNEIVDITGTPRLSLTVGTTTRYANYLSGSGTNTIVFRYTVLASHLDANGIAISTTLSTNGGTIKDVATNSQSPLTFTAPVLTGVNVDGVLPTVASVTAPANATYVAGAILNFTLNFSEAVVITGIPQVSLNVGGVIRYADYVSGSGTTAILFRYTVLQGDLDTNGIQTVTPIVLNGGTIKDLNTNAFAGTFTATTYSNVRIDTVGPTVSSVTLPANNTYENAGSRPTLSFSVYFSENVLVTGTPRLQLQIGANLRYANYASGSNSTRLIFTYPVAATDFDLDGIEVKNSSDIDLNSGTLKDAAGNTAARNIGSPDTSKVFVIFPAMKNWYDLSDASKITLSGSNITVIKDKIGTYNLTHTNVAGVPYNASGFNGGNDAYADCISSGSFNGTSTTTPIAIVAVYRAPVDTTNQYLFYSSSTARPMVQFTSLAGGGTVTSGVTGNQYIADNWGTASATTINFWNPDEAMIRGFFWSATQNRVQSVCQMTGEIAEYFTFSAKPTTAEMQLLEGYLNTRYGLSFP